MVPEGWFATQLGDCATFQSGGTPSKENASFWGGDIPWVSAKDLKQHYINGAQDHLTDLGASQAKIAAPNSVLMLVRGMTLMKDIPIGFVKRPVAFNQDVKALVANKGIDPLFLSYLLVGKKLTIMGLVNTANHGTGRLDTDLVRALPLDLPPLAEQQKIAEILSVWDKAIETTEALLANARTQKRALMQSLLTGTRRFPGFEVQPWREVRLGDIGKTISGGTPESENSAYWEGDIRWATPTDITKLKSRFICSTARMITEAGLKASAAKLVPKGAILVCTRATIGEVAISTGPICTNQGFKNIVLNGGYDADFVYYLLQFFKKDLIRYACGSTFLEISKADFDKRAFRFPTLAEQIRIAEALNAIEEEIDEHRLVADHLRTEKKALMQQLLTGKRRVVV